MKRARIAPPVESTLTGTGSARRVRHLREGRTVWDLGMVAACEDDERQGVERGHTLDVEPGSRIYGTCEGRERS